jgi:hypothetical protein
MVAVLLAVAFVVGIAYLALNPNIASQFNISQPTANQGLTPSLSVTATTGLQNYGKNFNVGTQTKDTLDRTIVYGDDTEVNTICWDAHGSDDVAEWTDIGTFSEAEIGDANIDIDEATFNSDGSVKSKGLTEMWCEINLESAQDFAVDQEEIIRANDRIDSCIWGDANDDNDDTWICKYDLLGITPVADPNSEPSDTVQLYLFDRETDETIVGATTNTYSSVAQGDGTITEVTTKLVFGASADAKMISEIRIRNNETSSTDDDYSEETELCMSEDSTAEVVWFDTRQPVGCLALGDTGIFDRDNQASTIEYVWDGGNEYKDSILVILPKNANLDVDTPINVHTNFQTATTATCWELGYKYLDAFGSEASYDVVDFEVNAGTAGTVCTL